MPVAGAARRPRVLAVASHPIQYHAPWFRGLAAAPSVDFSVLFVQIPDAKAQGQGFGVAFNWDVPVLDGYRWLRVPRLRGRGGLSGFFAARVDGASALLRELAPDVVILTGWHAWPLLQFLWAARRARVTVLMRGEANALRSRPWPARAMHRLLLSACSACLPIGRASRDFYRGYGIPEDRLFDAPYFVDNARFGAAAASAQPQRAALRERWSIPQGAVCFGYAGKLEPKKRITDLLAALEIARLQGAPAHLLVVGTGELESQAREFVRARNLPVTFAGFLNQSEIASAYVALDVLVLPSDFGETWGLVVNEAMACGRPAIVSDRVGCGPDLVEPGVTGEVFAFGDVAGLADRMLRFTRHPQVAETMGEAARARVLRDYGPENAVAGTLRAIDALGSRR
jgi:glycosyltransferase involved in cell wall biosynthesis